MRGILQKRQTYMFNITTNELASERKETLAELLFSPGIWFGPRRILQQKEGKG